LLNALPEDGELPLEPEDTPRSQLVTEIDPGWVLGQRETDSVFDTLGVIAERPWWPVLVGAPADALVRHWRHAVAVSQAARRLARECGDPQPDQVARAGLLHGLGRWALAAVDAGWLADWLAEADPKRRLDLERGTLGTEVSSLGRVLAERWGCDPLVIDSVWLHADRKRTLSGCASNPDRLALVQEAYDWAEQTPWALATRAEREPHAVDPRLRLLIAEVQVRCGSPFVEPDATPHEEKLARTNARLRRQVHTLQGVQQSRDRFLAALAESEPTEDPESWAERAGLCWCGEPGVTAARVVWTGPSAGSGASSWHERAAPERSHPPPDARDERPASVIVPLGERGRPSAELHLWTRTGSGHGGDGPAQDPALRAWRTWAALVAERAQLARRLEQVARAHHDRVASEEPRLRQSKLDALAEFAAGAGHELNNPLAVIVGRAQLLLVRETDPAAIRSLRAIFTQAQRAHRILRDLMYVARPPEPRPRSCQPDEIVRNCLRDLRDAADERGVRLIAEARGSELKVWADPDALRHVAEVLLKNALEATPKGGTIEVTTATTASASGAAEALSWIVQDNGRGISAAEGMHLFDPFYCGRQAGRGLGLGLPRAARIVAQAGGEIRWHSAPGQGSTFHVHLPLCGPPQAPADLGAPHTLPPRDDQSLLKS
jgi:signal transduction histidine kinase